jgi:hypothetical protein
MRIGPADYAVERNITKSYMGRSKEFPHTGHGRRRTCEIVL